MVEVFDQDPSARFERPDQLGQNRDAIWQMGEEKARVHQIEPFLLQRFFGDVQRAYFEVWMIDGLDEASIDIEREHVAIVRARYDATRRG